MISESLKSLRPTWYEIDVDAIKKNVIELRRLVGDDVSIFACMKRNGYGCGVVASSRACIEAGAHGIAVGNADDAVAVRKDGLSCPILVYPGSLASSASEFLEMDLIPTISTVDDAVAWDAALSKRHGVFLKVDVGLLRAGTMFNKTSEFFERVKSLKNLNAIGLYSHFFSYGAKKTTEHYMWQFNAFELACNQARLAGLNLKTIMVSSTNAIVDFSKMDLSAVDPGRVIFGLDSSNGARGGHFRPALKSFKTRIATFKPVVDFDVSGYTPPFPIKDGMVIGILPLGWGDGIPRDISDEAQVLVRGCRVPIIKPLHLEHLRVDLTNVPEVDLGDEVVLVGRQGEEEITLSELSKWWGIDEATFHGTMRDHILRVYI